MTLIEAIDSLKPFSRPHWGKDTHIQYCLPNTGPYKDTVDCDYFVVTEDSISSFSTSLDLYPEDIKASDYIHLNS